MILYHFTRPAYVDSILKNGINRGDVPTTPTEGFQAPWLTSNPEPARQKWVVTTDKNEVRMTVDVKKQDNLYKWSSYAKAIGMEESWYNTLDYVGGNESDNWYIYLGRIPPSWIIEVEHLGRE